MYSKEEIQIMNLDDNYTPGREPGGLEGTERKRSATNT